MAEGLRHGLLDFGHLLRIFHALWPWTPNFFALRIDKTVGLPKVIPEKTSVLVENHSKTQSKPKTLLETIQKTFIDNIKQVLTHKPHKNTL